VCVCVSRVEELVGRQLAVIGDEVDVQYASVFNKMIDSLSVNENTLYSNFATIARQSVLSSCLITVRLSVCQSVCLSHFCDCQSHSK